MTLPRYRMRYDGYEVRQSLDPHFGEWVKWDDVEQALAQLREASATMDRLSDGCVPEGEGQQAFRWCAARLRVALGLPEERSRR